MSDLPPPARKSQAATDTPAVRPSKGGPFGTALVLVVWVVAGWLSVAEKMRGDRLIRDEGITAVAAGVSGQVTTFVIVVFVLAFGVTAVVSVAMLATRR